MMLRAHWLIFRFFSDARRAEHQARRAEMRKPRGFSPGSVFQKQC